MSAPCVFLGRKKWRKCGIEAHIQVEPTVEDVINDEDRLLKTALGYLRNLPELVAA